MSTHWEQEPGSSQPRLPGGLGPRGPPPLTPGFSGRPESGFSWATKWIVFWEAAMDRHGSELGVRATGVDAACRLGQGSRLPPELTVPRRLQ